jgi:hypothetical protein
MSKRRGSRKQKMYNMKGCSKTRKHYLGGSGDVTLAYTGHKNPTVSNPFLIPKQLLGGANKYAYPNEGATIPPPNGVIFNNASQQNGGCGCGIPLMTGGKSLTCGKSLTGDMGFIVGGVRHRFACKCSKCKKRSMKGGNPYPNGLVGSPWSSNINNWSGVDGVPGNHNYIANNTYNNDDSRQMIDVNTTGGKRKQKGGTLSNFMTQDLINLGRQFQFGVGSAYNALAGYSSPVNPLPWKDHFPNKTLATTI